MMRKIVACLILMFSAILPGQEFELRISLENAHVREIYFACQKGATAGYDRGKDIFCPPGGMGDMGLAWFVALEPQLPNLYKDIKDCTFPQQWELLVQPPKRKIMSLNWETEKFPDGLDFQLSGDGVILDMKKTKKLLITKNGTFQITVRKSEPEKTDEKK